MIKYKQDIFNGIAVGIDKLDVPQGSCIDCANLVISTYGRIENTIGLSKIVTTALGDQIDALHQLGTDEYAITGGNVKKL